MDTELQKFLVQPTGNPSPCGQNFPAQGPARRLRLNRAETLSVARGLASLCLVFVVLTHFIRIAPDKITIQQDSAELARIEAQTQVDDARSAMPAPPRMSNVDGGRTNSKAKDHSQSKVRQPRAIARRNGSVDKKIDLASSEANEEPKTIKRYQQRQRERDLQRQQAVDSSRQRYAQQESAPLLRAIGRALGFPTQ
jgi:hypothetical protein